MKRRDFALKILAFGGLPKEAGGKQTQGLSYATFEIAKGLCNLGTDLEYDLCCTDVNSSVKQVARFPQGIRVIGWTKRQLIFSSIVHPGLVVTLLRKAIRYRHQYQTERSTLKTLMILLYYATVRRIHKPDLLHIHGTARSMFLNCLPSIRDLPRVTTLHGVIGFDENLPAGCQAIESDALKTNSYFVFVSNKTQRTLLSHYESVPSRYTVIPNGIDLQKFRVLDRNECRHELNLPLDKTILLTIGSLSKRKGQSLILDSVASFPHDVQERICCVFVGNGVSVLKDTKETLGFDLRLYEHVEQERLVQFYNAADYHLSASSSEGFGMVMTESLACGTPIILPRTCDLVEEDFIVEGMNSVIYEEPSVPSIIEAVRRALSSQFCRQVVRDTVAHMSWDQIAARYSNLFRSLV